MNKNFRYVLVLFVLASMLLGACAGAPSTGSSKVEAASVSYTGTIDSISGNQWIVNGQAITVDPSVVRDGPFNVGDTVKVEVEVGQDGTITVTRVEVPSSTDLSSLPALGNDNSNVNSNDDNSNGNINDNANDDNSNANSNGNTNDDHGGNSNSSGSNGNDDNSNGDDEVFGTVQAMTSTSITVDDQAYDLSGVEIKGAIQIGDFVKLHLVQNADGSFSLREVELSDQSQVGNGNDNDDNGNSVNSNDGNDDNSNDSNSNDDNSNGSNSNDDNSNDSNSNDDNSSGGGNDNGGGHGGGNDNGGGGNSNG